MSVKVSDQSKVRPVMTLSGFLGGSVESGPSGQVPTANGSNQVAWGSNVAIITSNGSNALLGPYVNFSAGSNILFTLDRGPFPDQAYPSNTLRIHAHPDLSALLTVVGAKAYATATQDITLNTETAVLFDSEEFDTDGFHTTTVSSRFTIPPGRAGKYLLQAGGNIPNIGTTLDFKVNGTTFVRGGGSGSAPSRLTTMGFAELSVGDYVEAIVFAPSNTTIGHASALQSQMSMTIIRLGL